MFPSNVGIIIAFWVLFTVTYLGATEVLSMAKSKGEILIFRRSHFGNKKSILQMTETNDEEAPGLEKATIVQSAVTDEAHPISHEGQIFH